MPINITTAPSNPGPEAFASHPPDGWRGDLVALLALAGVALLHGAVLLLWHKTYFAAPDNTTQFWAWYQKEASVLHAGGFPLWDQNTLGGHSFVGETQTGVFYPLNLIWLLILGSSYGIGPRSLDLLIVLHLLIGSAGMYALARSFGVRRSAAVITGVVFAYTGVVFSRATGQTAIFFGLTLVPWAVFFCHRQLETGRLRYAVGTGAAIGLAVLAGHFQPPFHAAVLVVLFYVLTRPPLGSSWRRQLRPRGLALIVSFGVGAVVAAPQLAYSLPYFEHAYRFIGAGAPVPPGGSVSFQTFSNLYSGAPDTLLSLLDPQRYPVPDGNSLFIGIGALVVVIVGLLVARKGIRARFGRYRLALTAALLVGSLAMLGSWTPFPAALYALPLVSQVRELARYSIMVHLCLCLILAFAIDAILAQRLVLGGHSRRSSSWLLVALGWLVALDGIYLIIRPTPGADDWFGIQLLLGGLVLSTMVAWVKLGWKARIVVLGTLIIAGSLENGLQTLGSTSSPFYPTRYYARTPAISYAEQACRDHRTLVLANALPVNVGDVFRELHTVNGYGATMQAAYYDFITGSPPTSIEQTALLDVRCIVSQGPVSVPGYHVGYRDIHGLNVSVNDGPTGITTAALVPVPSIPLVLQDRRVAYRFSLDRLETVILSANVYPGWTLRLDGRAVRAGAFRVHGVPVFPELTVGAGRHTLQYSWSGSPF